MISTSRAPSRRRLRRQAYPSAFHLIHFGTFASHLLLANYDIQTIQKLLGHGDVRTTMIYLLSNPCLKTSNSRKRTDLRSNH